MPQYSGIWTLSQASQAIKDNNWTGITPQNVEYLVVAGGGSGGLESYSTGAGGGGGAGGLLAGYAGIVIGTSYTITIGAGGASIIGTNPGGGSKGNNGNNSVFGPITAIGGGGGGKTYFSSASADRSLRSAAVGHLTHLPEWRLMAVHTRSVYTGIVPCPTLKLSHTLSKHQPSPNATNLDSAMNS